jgi:hypothetical protein
MPWSRRQFAIAHLTQMTTERLLADRGAILLHHPLHQIAQPPANHAMHTQDRAILDKLSVASRARTRLPQILSTLPHLRRRGEPSQFPDRGGSLPGWCAPQQLLRCRGARGLWDQGASAEQSPTWSSHRHSASLPRDPSAARHRLVRCPESPLTPPRTAAARHASRQSARLAGIGVWHAAWWRSSPGANGGCDRPRVASPPVRDDGPWRLIVQRTLNICASRCKARIIRRDGSTARLSDPTGKLTGHPRIMIRLAWGAGP